MGEITDRTKVVELQLQRFAQSLAVNVRELLLEREAVGAAGNVRTDYQLDHFGHVFVETLMAGNERTETKKEKPVEVRWPASWWDAVKVRFAPRWWLRKWPPHFASQSIVPSTTHTHVTRVCPHLAADRRDGWCLKFLMFDDPRRGGDDDGDVFRRRR